MPLDLVIRNAYLTQSDGEHVGSVGIVGERIVAVGEVSEQGVNEIEAHGLHLMPGFIDTQVHFREPGLEHKEDIESGTRAAILGGVTTIFEMPNTQPPTTTEAALEDKLNRAEGRAWCDFGFFVGASEENSEELRHLEMLPGTPGIKIFMGSSTGSLLVDQDEALRKVLKNGVRRCPVHAEDEARNRSRKSLISDHPHAREHPFLRDAESARLATERILRLSDETGRPIHVLHVSTLDELPLLENAKARKLETTCEVTPQHLWFHGPECYDRLGSLAQMNPPIRSIEHRTALREAVKAGLFDVVGSDHAPHTLEEKSQPYPQSPSGMPGVQTLVPAMLTLVENGVLRFEHLIRLGSMKPAEIFGIKNKGRIEPGYDADLILVDRKRKQVFERSMVASKCGWSPYEGETFTGWPVHVLLRGRHMVADGELIGEPIGRPATFDWKIA